MAELNASDLTPGTLVQVIKLHPDGHEVTRYQAIVADEECPPGWFAVEAAWVNPTVSPHGLVFETGDALIEFFSTGEWFNVFRVQSPSGETRGWYANVTYPTLVDREGATLTVTWHDLYLDVIRLADGRVILCDEDELAESALPAREPELHEQIRHTAEAMVRLAETSAFPFHLRH